MNTKLRSFLFVLLAMGVAGFTFSRRATTEPLPAEPRSAEAVTGTTNITLNYQGQLNNGTAPVNGNATFIFKLYGTLTGGTECWSETQTLNVQNGLFNALLGSVTAIPDSCVVNDTYLELVVNNTTLTPRELVNQFANTVPNSTQTRGDLWVGNELYAGNIYSRDTTWGVVTPAQIHMPNDGNLYLNWHSGGGLYFGGGTQATKFGIDASGNANIIGNADIRGGATVGADLYVRGVHASTGLSTNSISSLINTDLIIDAGYGSVNNVVLADNVVIGGSGGNLTVNNNLTVGGTCSASVQGKAVADATCGQISANSVQTGAVIEANLQTDEEKAMARIERFEQGDLLCWSAEAQQLDLCTLPNDRLVMAVADVNGKPIVMGAEPVKVIGRVTAGDSLVASDVAGYAIVNNDAPSIAIVAQALEDFDGTQGMIKAMILK